MAVRDGRHGPAISRAPAQWWSHRHGGIDVGTGVVRVRPGLATVDASRAERLMPPCLSRSRRPTGSPVGPDAWLDQPPSCSPPVTRPSGWCGWTPASVAWWRRPGGTPSWPGRSTLGGVHRLGHGARGRDLCRRRREGVPGGRHRQGRPRRRRQGGARPLPHRPPPPVGVGQDRGDGQGRAPRSWGRRFDVGGRAGGGSRSSPAGCSTPKAARSPDELDEFYVEQASRRRPSSDDSPRW